MTQLFGDRLYIANATGCSSIYGGNLPTTPYTVNKSGRGPTWSNSLFEDNAEFGLGMRLALDAFREQVVDPDLAQQQKQKRYAPIGVEEHGRSDQHADRRGSVPKLSY